MANALMSDDEVFGAAPKAAPSAPGGLMSDADVFGTTSSHQAAQPTDVKRSWAEVPGEAISNLLPSIGNQIKGIAQAVVHPLDTARSMRNVVQGASRDIDAAIDPSLGKFEATHVPLSQQTQRQWDAAKKFYGDRYGTAEGFKNALATDPAGVMADAATVLSGGELAGVRAPGAMGSVARAAGKVGRDINPLNVPINVANAGIRGVNKGVNAVRNASAPLSPEAEAYAHINSLAKKENVTPDQIAGFMPDKPATGAEAIGPSAVSSARALGIRSGQTGRAALAQLGERAAGTGDRMLGDFEDVTGISPEAARGNINAITTKGRERAKPLYEKAFNTSGTGSFVGPLTDAFDGFSKRSKEAAGAAQDADREVTMLAAKQHQTPMLGEEPFGRFVQSDEMQAAQSRLSSAQEALKEAESGKASVLSRLKQAQTDEAAGIRGGVWSPRIQQFLDHPIARTGLARGREELSLEALRDNTPIKDKDLAITGNDADGNPVIGGVPNMRTLDTVKRGIDEMIGDYRDKTTGRLPAVKPRRLQLLLDNRKEFLGAVDPLNDDYKAARAASSDYLGAQDAFDSSARMFSNSRISADQFTKHISSLGQTDLEAAKGGIANWLFDQADNGRLKGKTYDRPRLQKKLTALLGPDKAATLLDKAEMENRLAGSGQYMMPRSGSPTFGAEEAAAEQDRVGAAMDATHGALKVASGHFGSGFKKLGSAASKLGAFARTPGMATPTRDVAGRAFLSSPTEMADYLRNPPAAPIRHGIIPHISQRGRLGLLGAAQTGQIAQQPYRRGGFV